MIWTG